MGLLKVHLRTKVEQLGNGVSGTVERHTVERHGGRTKCFVVKTYHCKEKYETRHEYRERVLHEYHVLNRLQHRNFIEAVKYTVSLDGRTIKMYMEAGSRDLYILFKNATVSQISVNEALCLWKQACTGIMYLHALGMCHRDLKLENMVWDAHCSALKIIDLATAVTCETPATGLVGSSRYMAPETYAQISYDGAASDVWSLGIILFYMLTRRFPWKEAVHADADFVSYVSNVSESPHLQPLTSKISEEGVILLKEILCPLPKNRVSMAQIHQYAWFGNISFCGGQTSCSGPHMIDMQSETTAKGNCKRNAGGVPHTKH